MDPSIITNAKFNPSDKSELPSGYKLGVKRDYSMREFLQIEIPINGDLTFLAGNTIKYNCTLNNSRLRFINPSHTFHMMSFKITGTNTANPGFG